MDGVVDLGHGVQDDALRLHHGALQQAELLLLQLPGQLPLPARLGGDTQGSDGPALLPAHPPWPTTASLLPLRVVPAKGPQCQ